VVSCGFCIVSRLLFSCQFVVIILFIVIKNVILIYVLKMPTFERDRSIWIYLIFLLRMCRPNFVRKKLFFDYRRKLNVSFHDMWSAQEFYENTQQYCNFWSASIRSRKLCVLNYYMENVFKISCNGLQLVSLLLSLNNNLCSPWIIDTVVNISNVSIQASCTTLNTTEKIKVLKDNYCDRNPTYPTTLVLM